MRFLICGILLMITSCTLPATESTTEPGEKVADYAIAIHGGAGVISKDIDPDIRAMYEIGLETALRMGQMMLDEGRSALDVVEAVVRVLENDSLFNAGLGAVYTNTGEHVLDASIMDGSSVACGAITIV